VSIEIKNECDEPIDSATLGATFTGYILPDPTLGKEGYSFIGINPSGSRFFLRHFIKS
jgi:hypothetical protein